MHVARDLCCTDHWPLVLLLLRRHHTLAASINCCYCCEYITLWSRMSQI